MNYLNNVSDKNLKGGGDYIHDLEKPPQKTETEKTQEHMILAKFNTYCEN